MNRKSTVHQEIHLEVEKVIKNKNMYKKVAVLESQVVQIAIKKRIQKWRRRWRMRIAPRRTFGKKMRARKGVR